MIPENDITEVVSTFDKNSPVLHGCFDEKRTVPMDVYSVISVRGEAAPLALLNVADDFIKLGWVVASDGEFEQVENSVGLIAAANEGLALSAPIDMTDPDQVPIWGDEKEDAETLN
jgi:tellurite resistance protein